MEVEAEADEELHDTFKHAEYKSVSGYAEHETVSVYVDASATST